MKDLTNSNIERQNILNNRFALAEIQKTIGIKGLLFENELKFTKKQISEFFEVSERTIDNYLEKNESELSKNGYEVITGKRLIDFKLVFQNQFDNEMDFVIKTVRLGIFNFKALLNIGMLLTDSIKARELRSTILNIVIETIKNRTKGSTKYINQKDEDYIFAAMKEPHYRDVFTDALSNYVEGSNLKYAIYTNKIYISIFQENAAEYRQILKLEEKEKVRDTMYSEILRLIAAYENGLAEEIKKLATSYNRKISFLELDKLFQEFENHSLWEPLIIDARVKMASRDLGFREAFHYKLEKYIKAIDTEDFERFLGEKSKELSERLEETKEVFKQLKEID